MELSGDQVLNFKKNPHINPLTNRKIVFGKTTYNALLKACEKFNINNNSENDSDIDIDEITCNLSKIKILSSKPKPMTLKEIKEQFPILESKLSDIRHPNFSYEQKSLLRTIYGNNLRRLGLTTAKEIIGEKFYGLNRQIDFIDLLCNKNRESNIISYKLTHHYISKKNKEIFNLNVKKTELIKIQPFKKEKSYDSKIFPFYVFIKYE